MATSTRQEGSNTIKRLTECPYCGADLRGKKASAHIPCDAVPTTEEVVQALKEKGIR